MNEVKLTVNGNSCIMENQYLRLDWNERACIDAIYMNGKDISGVSDMGKDSFYVDYNAHYKFHRFRPSKFEILDNNGNIAHVAYTDTTGLLYIEYHIIMLSGEKGFYSFVVAGSNSDTTFELSELRVVCRFGNKIFNTAYNNERKGLQPTKSYMKQFECLMDETYRLPDGELYTNGDVYSKYDYAGYFSKNPAYGHAGNGYGFFLIPVSTEYYAGGPQKQDLLMHYDGIVLNYFTGAHFGTGPLIVETDWKKFYGPFMWYFNEGDDNDALYADALKKAEIEKAKWPYQWVSHPMYPLNRSTVKGTLTFSDGSPCNNTTVLLAQSGLCLERQSADYIFYAYTDENGNFTIPHVRMGSYTLYAYQTGGHITQQPAFEGVNISGETCNLGNLTFEIPNRNVLWQLGKATRTCEGYKYSGELRNYKWHHMTPSDITFTIGESNEAEDWYYAQTVAGTWQINFNLDKVEDTDYYLTVALAGVTKGNISEKTEACFTIRVNGKLLHEKCYINDGSIYRSATLSGRYRRIEVKVDPAILKPGINTVSFVNDSYMAMYDTVIFEKEN